MILLRHDTAGDPCSDLRWTRRTTRNLAAYLTDVLDLLVSPRTVARQLRSLSYSPHVNHKCIPPCSPAERNDQFEFIDQLRRDGTRRNSPILSIDTTRKRAVGRTLPQCRRVLGTGPLPVHDHDFRSYASGLAVPQGIYDTLANRGFVSLGVSSDTAFFAVDNLDAWWRSEGRAAIPRSPNSSCSPIAAAATPTASPLGSTPSSTAPAMSPGSRSPWPTIRRANPIERRLFTEIRRNWSGCPLESFELILNYIATTTRTGLVVTSRFNPKEYSTGIQIGDEQMAALNLTPDRHIPKWNYTISPCPN